MATLMRVTVKSLRAGGAAGLGSAVPSRRISGKQLRCVRPLPCTKPPPFDYANKHYTLLNQVFDKTTHRFDDNTKVIVVDGPIASGKSAFAEALAEDLGMCHIPEANIDMFYKRPNGVDLREFDPLVPEDTRTFDQVDFCKNPTHRNVAAFQLITYRQRYIQYLNALEHLMNTGEGIVMERSAYSDFVFVEAMFAEKFISPEAYRAYYEVRKNTLDELLKPHLVIYLDVPAAEVRRKICERGRPHEVSSKALTDNFLKTMEYQYKHKYLGDISTHAELLVYDWTEAGDIESVVEDIERLNFDQYTLAKDPKMKDWRYPTESHWTELRVKYTNHKAVLVNHVNLPITYCPELIISADDAFLWDQVVYSHPQFEYELGYSKALGDTGLLFKDKNAKHYEYI